MQSEEREAIDLLVFDMGHVFIDFEWDQVCRGFCDRAGVSEDEFGAVLRYLGALGYEKGEISTGDFLGELNSRMDSDIDHEEFTRLWTTTFRPNHRMIALFEHLRSTHRMYLLSNTNVVHYEHIENSFNIARHFEELILSYEVGSTKPEDAIYREVFARSGLKPGSCLFVDDLEQNIRAAKELGMNAIHFQDADSLFLELTNLGIVDGEI